MSAVREYTICNVRDEVQALVSRGAIGRHHRIYSLCTFFNYREWINIEKILEDNDFLLRDRVLDLLGQEAWVND